MSTALPLGAGRGPALHPEVLRKDHPSSNMAAAPQVSRSYGEAIISDIILPQPSRASMVVVPRQRRSGDLYHVEKLGRSRFVVACALY